MVSLPASRQKKRLNRPVPLRNKPCGSATQKLTINCGPPLAWEQRMATEERNNEP
jgi:hypothetical protein